MLPQEWERSLIDPIEAYETMIRVAQQAEQLGFASIWLFDHFDSSSVPSSAERMFFECWTSTAAIARETTHIRIGQLVTCNSFRNPSLLAKMAPSTLMVPILLPVAPATAGGSPAEGAAGSAAEDPPLVWANAAAANSTAATVRERISVSFM